MAYIENNIQFNSFDSNISTFGKKIGNEQYSGITIDDLSDIASENGEQLPTTINALDIDWNGAKPNIPNIPENGITTTGDLVEEVYSPMFAKAA